MSRSLQHATETLLREVYQNTVRVKTICVGGIGRTKTIYLTFGLNQDLSHGSVVPGLRDTVYSKEGFECSLTPTR